MVHQTYRLATLLVAVVPGQASHDARTALESRVHRASFCTSENGDEAKWKIAIRTIQFPIRILSARAIYGNQAELTIYRV